MSPLRRTSRIGTVTASAAASATAAMLVLVLAGPAAGAPQTTEAPQPAEAPHPTRVTAEAEHPEAGPLALASAAVVGAAAGTGVWLLRRRARDTDDN
ncbi:hypothetical protein AB0H82_18595 [Streptomyces sp. NPDC050732]|uniref:hypothetical protein n=1 Tax=Streptomyces sp. NPDC050732 TaxID=3154632 RepID=UPI00342A65D5